MSYLLGELITSAAGVPLKAFMLELRQTVRSATNTDRGYTEYVEVCVATHSVYEKFGVASHAK